MMKSLPRNLRFDVATVPGTLRVSYARPPETPRQEAEMLEEPLDVWGVAWAQGREGAPRVVDVRPPRGLSRAQWRTLVLRMEVLDDLLAGFEFRLDGTRAFLRDAAEIREDLRRGLIFTYDQGNIHRGTPTGAPVDAVPAAAWIADHWKTFLGGAFPHGLRSRFPVHGYKTRIDEKQRVFAKSWIPLVGADRDARLAVLQVPTGELTPAHLAAGLDGAILCRGFLPHLRRNWFPEATADGLSLVLAAETFHPALLDPAAEAGASLVGAMRRDAWLGVTCVRIDPAGLPKDLPAQVVFPVPEAPAA